MLSPTRIRCSYSHHGLVYSFEGGVNWELESQARRTLGFASSLLGIFAVHYTLGLSKALGQTPPQDDITPVFSNMPFVEAVHRLRLIFSSDC
jgi:hypothetical protein